jgi:hypothetical protein
MLEIDSMTVWGKTIRNQIQEYRIQAAEYRMKNHLYIPIFSNMEPGPWYMVQIMGLRACRISPGLAKERCHETQTSRVDSCIGIAPAA